MASAFLDNIGETNQAPFVSAEERATLKEWLGLKIDDKKFAGNLERLMEALYGARFVLDGADGKGPQGLAKVVDRVIDKVTRFVLNSCTKGAFATGDDTVLSLYQSFYQKLQFRERSLPRPGCSRPITTFSTNARWTAAAFPTAMAFPVLSNGASIRRCSATRSPSRLDISSRKWSTVDSFVYLCKLHGSVNWVEDGETLFPVRELAEVPTSPDGRVLIYPTPAKQSASFVSPYADLFREFQTRVVQDQSVLVTVGYSFGDQHINNIIFQALTIPNFRLIIFAAEDTGGVIQQLRQLGIRASGTLAATACSRCGPHIISMPLSNVSCPSFPAPGLRMQSKKC
ncbi:SIR2 family protein [Sphingomonas aurantiaca]|uniref:hypothetical protein n=1 Tax=Sphingomonas aurantiaca TaxID=185949 RepID=UPI002FDF325B